MHKNLASNSIFGLIVAAVIFSVVLAPGVAAVHDSIVTITPNIANCDELGNTFIVNVANVGPITNDDIFEVRIYDETYTETYGILEFHCGPAPDGWTLFDYAGGDPSKPHFGYCDYITLQFGSDVIEPGENLDFTFDAVMFEENCYSRFLVSTLDNILPIGECEYHTPEVKIDCSPPEINKEVDFPKIPGVGFDYWVTSNTDLDLSASDNTHNCDQGLDYCQWRVTLDGVVGEWNLVENGPTLEWTINLIGDSNHYLEVECYDVAGNMAPLTEMDKVDNTPPVTTKVISDPKKVIKGDQEGEFIEWVDTVTTITFNPVDPDPTTHSCNVGVDKTWYMNVIDLTERTCWDPANYCKPLEFPAPCADGCMDDCQAACDKEIPRTDPKWYDCVETCAYSECQVDPLWKLYRGVPISKPEESCHVLQYFSIDHLGNTEKMNVNCFFVDKTPPLMKKDNGQAIFGEGEPAFTNEGNPSGYFAWITTKMPITFTCDDTYGDDTEASPHPSEGEKLCYKVSYDYPEWDYITEKYCTHELDDEGYCCEPVNEAKQFVFNFQEESMHNLEYYCVDAVEKATTSEIQYYKVDDTPPYLVYKNIKGPFYAVSGDCPPNDESDICHLDGASAIYFGVEDGGDICAVDDVTCVWGYYLDGGQFYGWYATYPIQFPEETRHDLVIKCKDALGNEKIVDEETFFVDKTPPVTTKSFSGPQYPADSELAIVLGTAGDFVILAKSGISTTGTTSIVGDIGISPAAASYITGFGLVLDGSGQFATSSLVTGKVYAADYAPPTPAKMTTAISDMEAAYTDLAGRAADVTELGAGNIGGMTLAPGVYKWSTGVTIPTDVTLSGGANDVWIFQIAQTLDISSGKKVILSGDAQAKNIFWVVAGQTTLGTNSVFNGNILDKTAIVLQTGATLNGRALAQTAVTLDANTVSSPGVVAATPHWISSGTSVTLSVYDAGPHKSGIDETKYRITLMESDAPCLDNSVCQEQTGEGEFLIYDGTFKIDEESCHLIEYYSIDNVGKTEEIKRQCVFVENTAPTVDKVVGQPQKIIGDKVYITKTTPIDLYCNDLGDHPVDHVSLWYRYRISDDCEKWGPWTEWVDPIETTIMPGAHKTIYFPGDSCHQLEYYCIDALGNKAGSYYEIDVVDTQAPVITKTVVGPQIGTCPPEEKGDICYIDGKTIIHVEVVDPQPHPVNEVICKWDYEVVGGEKLGQGAGEVTPPFDINFPEESEHILSIKCTDALGNEVEDVETFFVDKTPPSIDKQYGLPYYDAVIDNYYAEWITSDTPIYGLVADAGPHKSGIAEVKYRTTRINDEYCKQYREVKLVENGGPYLCENAVGDGEWTTVDPEDYDEFVFNIKEDSCHLIEIYAEDNVEKSSLHKQCVFVDNQAPDPIKTVGEPKWMWDGSDAYYYDIADKCWKNEIGETLDETQCKNDPWCIECWRTTLLTPIYLECNDPIPHPVDHETVCFNVEWDADDVTQSYCQGELTYNEKYGKSFCCVDHEMVFNFGETTEHELEYYCIDALGNTNEKLDIEKFKVEDTSFNITLNKKWNLISVPVFLLEDNPEAVFSHIADKVKGVWTYDPTNEMCGEDWCFWIPGPAGDNIPAIEPGWGYWVLMEDGAVLEIGGSLMRPGPMGMASKEIVPGWNLIGYYGADGQLSYNGPEGNGGSAYCELFSLGEDIWSKEFTGLWTYWEPDNPYQWKELGLYSNMDPGAGYWLATPQSGLYTPSTICGGQYS